MRRGSFWWRARRPVAALMAALLTACYTYRPVEPGGPSPGEDVRVALDGPTSEALERRTGRDHDRLEGRVVRAASDSLALSVSPFGPRGSDPFGTRRDTVALALGGLETVERKELATGKTLLLVGGAVGAVALITAAWLSNEGSAGGGGGNGGNHAGIAIPLSLP